MIEIALYEEVRLLPLPASTASDAPPVPGSPDWDSQRLPETVTHPDLIALLHGDLSPSMLVNAATVLKDRSLDGEDMSGQVALFLRCARPRLRDFPSAELERLAAAVSYLAIGPGNPFLSLEWLGHFLTHVGITDRTFTILVNSSEAASIGGYHNLAGRVDRLFIKLRGDWRIPDSQIPFVEHVEAEQQRLLACAFRLEHIGRHQYEAGDCRRAIGSLEESIDLATKSTNIAYRVLTDVSSFPRREIDGKARCHGGDLVWPWALATGLRVVEPALLLRQIVEETGMRRSEANEKVLSGTHSVRTVLDGYDEPLVSPRFRRWYNTAQLGLASLTGG